MALCEVFSVLNEVRAIRVQGWRNYLSPFNLIENIASVCVFISAYAYWHGDAVTIQAVGSMGVFLRWMDLLYYLQMFESTALYIRMIIVIFADVAPFLCVLAPPLHSLDLLTMCGRAIMAVVIMGSAAFFAVAEGNNPYFGKVASQLKIAFH